MAGTGGAEVKRPPIEPQEYLSGVTVVDIGDLRVARGLTRRPFSSCRHARLHYDKSERRIWCRDCEQDVEAFDAFELLVAQYNRAYQDMIQRQRELDEAERFQARSLAARALDDAWRKRKSVPACPTCKSGLFPEDFAGGVKTTLGRDYAEAQRRRRMEKGGGK